MASETQWFFVSTQSGKIETDDQGSPLHYRTQADAEDSIRTGEHGDYGTRYVVKADLETVSVATRSWELRVVETPPADPFSPPPAEWPDHDRSDPFAGGRATVPGDMETD